MRLGDQHTLCLIVLQRSRVLDRLQWLALCVRYGTDKRALLHTRYDKASSTIVSVTGLAY